MKERKKVRFFSSLQFKYALSYIMVLAVVLLLLNTYPVLASQDLVFRSKQDALKSRSAVIASTLADLNLLTGDRVAQVLSLLDNSGLTRLLVTDGEGRILYDSTGQIETPREDGEPGQYRYALFKEVVWALSGRDVACSSFEGGTFFSTAAMPITYRNETVGAVYVCEEDGDQGALLMGLQRTVGSISTVVALVVAVLSLLFSRMFTARIGALLRAIRIVGTGEYSHRIKPKGNDELTRLAEEFNQLTGRLEQTEEVRRRFVSDASHELKTPLASIRLLTDSILQNDGMDRETGREFVTDIGNEAERLTRITQKLLTLTRLDSLTAVQEESLDAGTVCRKVLRMLRPVADKAGVSLTEELPDGFLVRCSGDDFYQICFNLVENAIKYNKPGGQVLAYLYREEDRVCLEVADTGLGIPEEDRDKIFDRFYRVDKARSRSAGGTGLGLSIVQDMVRRHGGTVQLRSSPEGGSVFTVALLRGEEEEDPA